jgi:hypothetical protein
MAESWVVISPETDRAKKFGVINVPSEFLISMLDLPLGVTVQILGVISMAGNVLYTVAGTRDPMLNHRLLALPSLSGTHPFRPVCNCH